MAASMYVPRDPKNTLLHQVFKNHWFKFLNSTSDADEERSLPSFVLREVEDYFKCGIREFGFVRLYCKDCKQSQYLAFSCKRRGFCPSCCARRMNFSSAKLADSVFPKVPTRQWVMSFPFELRYKMAYDPKVTSYILRVFTNKVMCWYRKQARAKGVKKTKAGGVTVIQRAGGALNLNVHFHSIFLDGVYSKTDSGKLLFTRIQAPTTVELEKIVRSVIKSINKKLSSGKVTDSHSEELIAQLQLAMASVTSHVASGIRSGKRLRRIKQSIDERTTSKSSGVNIAGFSMHAGVAVSAKKSEKLEKLCRYISRGPLAQNRLYRLPGDRLGYNLKTPWRDGTKAIVFSPVELIEKLVALIPPPRANLTRFHGVLAPNAKWRSEIVPIKRDKRLKDSKLPFRTPNMTWAEMMKRVFDIDVTICSKCQGELKVIAVIQRMSIAATILRHEGLYELIPVFRRCPTRPPTTNPDGEVEQFSQIPPGW